MNFIDHTGHIFSIKDYPSFPIGYEYDECDYTFWMSDEYSSQLSIDCLYIKPIRLLLDGDVSSIEISISGSNIFKLLSSNTIQELIEKNDNPFEYIELNYATDEAINYYNETNQDVSSINDFTSVLKQDDLTVIDVYDDRYYYINDNEETIEVQNKSDIYKDDLSNDYIDIDEIEYKVFKKSDEFQFVPFYVIASTSDFGTWSTNVLIHVKYNDLTESYCPITVGGTFMNEFEELEINAKNSGISLPKDICRSLYTFSFWNETPNLSLWNQKIKELLLNYMKLHGERGNFQSALEALKWFGYGDKISIASLVQTDNNIIEQYIQDKFDIQYDVINEFQYFRNSTLLSLSIPAIIEDEESNELDFETDFWGEGKPKLKNLFDKTTIVHYDEGDIDFVKPYYNWTFNELGLKLCALKYYYQKYFLPIHLYIHRASITNQCFAGDIKMLNSARTWITEGAIYAPDNETHVEFPKQHTLWLYEQNRLVDENWIEDNNFQESIEDLNTVDEPFYNIIDNCFVLTIKLINDKWESEDDEQMFYCNMFAFQNENLLKHSLFSICSNQKEYSINFVICPKLLNKNFDNNFWFDKKYKIVLLCNGKWYNYEFNISIPELDIEIGRLNYKYDYKVCKQFSGFDGNKPNFNVSMYLPEIVTINNIDFVNDLCKAIENEHISKLDEPFFDDVITSNQVYYYFYDDEGKKTLLSSGDKTLVKENGKYVLKESRYSDNIHEIDRLVYSSTYKNIESLVDFYSTESIIPTNDNFLNKVYIFSLVDKDNNKFEYDNSYKAIHCTDVITNWKDNYYFESVSYELIHSISDILQKIENNEYIKENWEDKYYFYKDDSGNYIQLSNINKIESGITYYTCNNDIYYINNGNSYKAIHCKDVITNWKDNYYFESVSYKLIDSINDILKSKDNEFIKENWEDKYYFYKDDSGNYIQLSDIDEIESNITYYTCDSNLYYTNNCGLNNTESPLKLEFGEYRFNDNDSELIRDLYLNIFDENGNWTKDLKYWDYNINSWKESSIEKKLFDIYLMHDFDFWYIIMISKETIGNNENLDIIKDIYSSGNFIFKKERSENKFLINRMDYENMNGVYHFNPKDMIVSKLNNMKTIPFKLKIGSRWNFTPIGISKDHTNTFESNTNIGLLSMNQTDVEHSNGYYEVQVNYSIDNFVNHSQSRTTKILISDEF